MYHYKEKSDNADLFKNRKKHIIYHLNDELLFEFKGLSLCDVSYEVF